KMAKDVKRAWDSRNELKYPVQANEVLIRLSEEKIKQLQARGFEFHVWPGSTDIIRLVFSHATKEDDVELLIQALKT
ncbi:MAG: hypothetical protein L3J83_02180, partial [Proteobacteria bacterium]|nr:hypothetical protein [Pseudomonadota bacterium]